MRTLVTIILSVFITLGVVFGIGYYIAVEHRSVIGSYFLAAVPDSEIESRVELPTTSDDRIKDTIQAANPAVVSVVITKDIPIFERFLEEVPFGFFGNVLVPRVRQSGTEAREVGGGSGFVIEGGYIVTNRHVVDDTEASYSIVTSEGESYEVAVVAKDPVLDVAILELTDTIPEPLPELVFAAEEDVVQGETVIAIGNALAEFRNSVSVGVISGLSRTIVAGDREGMRSELSGLIQTDAAINPGNSGGPLINLNGEVVGVNVAASTEAENIGFALPAHVVEEVVNELVMTR